MSDYTELAKELRHYFDSVPLVLEAADAIDTLQRACANYAEQAAEQEVKTGRWIPVKPYNNTYLGFKCSLCGAQFQGIGTDNYCGNCGARMVTE